jgi:acetyl-CoA acetyltransferase
VHGREVVIVKAVRTPVGRGHPEKGYKVNAKLHQEVGTPFPPELRDRHPIVNQGLSAELIAERWRISRGECDCSAS